MPLAELLPGSPVDRVLLVREVEHRARRDGTPYLLLRISDRSAVLPAVAWRADGVEAVAGAAHHVVGVLEDDDRYGRQLVVGRCGPAGDDVDWAQLVDGPARDPLDLERELDAAVASIVDPALRRVVERLVGRDTDVGRRFRIAPAAKLHHHAYRNGLLAHSLEVAALVEAAARVFAGIDRDLAVAGALLHDIGKLDAYDSDPAGADLNDNGRLLGEIPLGFALVSDTVDAVGGLSARRARALFHIVLAHHGRLEYGSPVVPATREATLVHAMDHLSGQLGAYDRLAKETASGSAWSRFDRVLGTSALLVP